MSHYQTTFPAANSGVQYIMTVSEEANYRGGWMLSLTHRDHRTTCPRLQMAEMASLEGLCFLIPPLTFSSSPASEPGMGSRT